MRLPAASLGLGTVQWGMPYGVANRTGQPQEVMLRSLLWVAREAGIRTLDTARVYGCSEEVIGRLVSPGPDWQVVTKLSPYIRKGPLPTELRHFVHESLGASRRALRRERLDALLLHRAEQRLLASGCVWDCLRAERDAGRISRLGVSAGCPEEAFAALEDRDVEIIQVATSLLDQRLVRAGFFERAHSLGRTVMVRSVFLQGVAHIPVGELPPFLAHLREALEHINQWSVARGLTVAKAFLLFAQTIPAAITLLGCETLEQLQDNLQWWNGTVDSSELCRLASSIPDLPETILNPSLWPKAA